MTAVELMADFRSRGVELFVEGERLRFRGPKGAVTPEMRDAVAARRADLMAAVSPSADGWDAGRAATVLADCEAAINGALAVGGLAQWQQNFLEDIGVTVRRHAERKDAELWVDLEWINGYLAGWRQTR